MLTPTVTVGVSIGVASGLASEVVHAADASLYEAKRTKHLVPPRHRAIPR